MGLRAKLLLAASVLALVPLAAYHYLLSAQSFVRDTQQRATLTSARSVARAIQSEFPPPPPDERPDDSPYLYLLPLEAPPQVDGYPADWAELAPQDPVSETILYLGHAQGVIYLLLAVGGADAARFTDATLEMEDGPGFTSVWQVSISGAGERAVDELPTLEASGHAGFADGRFRAAVEPSVAGRVLELSFPAPLLGARLRIGLLDASSPGHGSRRLPAHGYFSLVRPAPALELRVRGLAEPGARRIWVLDARGHVLARDGDLPAAASADLVDWLLDRLLPEPDPSRLTLVPATGRLEAPEVSAALAGTEQTQWRRSQPSGALVVSAAVPVLAGDTAIGAVLVEDAIAALEGLNARGLAELTVASVVAFTAATLVLLVVSARLVARLRALRDAARRAIDDEGRVRAPFRAPRAKDELGDLGRSFATALERIQGYNLYLEQLARRLSHELRTPIAIIRSSLENLSLASAPDCAHKVYLQRATDGVGRLDAMLERMSEATRLEQAILDEDRELLDLRRLLAAVVGASADTWPDVAHRFESPESPVMARVSPHLVVQALEKLLANARDFRRPSSPVRIRIARRGAVAHIEVENDGAPLPPGLAARMFDSMVSERAGVPAAGAPHLGLGLYVVRLVAEGHGGAVFARDLADGSGVVVGFTLPTADDDP